MPHPVVLSDEQLKELRAILEEVAERLETHDEYRVDLNYMRGKNCPREEVWDEAARQALLVGWRATRAGTVFVVTKA